MTSDRVMTNRFLALAVAGVLLIGCRSAGAAGRGQAFTKVIFGSPSLDQDDFERFSDRARASGATHIIISAEDLPWSFWQYDTPGDPYPTWVISNLGLLKIAPPPAIRPYVSADYAEKILSLLEARCRILRRLGLKAVLTTHDPQMLPEGIFDEHPLWRGPRVDHSNRSRVARFAPSIDNKEILALFAEAIKEILRRCPEIEMLWMRTNDSGAGIDWSRGLYGGRSGNTSYRTRPMDQRLLGFFTALQQAAKSAGHSLEVELHNTKELDAIRLAAKLAPGMSVDNHEGPAGTAYRANVGNLMIYRNFFHPVLGIPQVGTFLDELEHAATGGAPRLTVSIPDWKNRDLYFRAYDAYRKAPPKDENARHDFLKELAHSLGRGDPEKLIVIWREIQEAQKLGTLLSSAGVVYIGSVMNRWLTRPLVPFPEELGSDEKAYYRRFILQARTEEHADNLMDVQASELFSGWSASVLARGIFTRIDGHLARAQSAAQTLKDAPLARRIDIFRRFLRSAANAVSYQAQLDRVRELGLKPDTHPVPETQPTWDRQMILETARAEIDNVAQLIELLEPRPGEFVELAATQAEEDIRVLGPNLIEQLRKKIRIMNAHWGDYDRIFTNPMKVSDR